MVTQNIKSAVTSAEKVLDGMEDIASSATGQEKSQEEIEIQNLERTAKKVINSTLNTAVDSPKIVLGDLLQTGAVKHIWRKYYGKEIWPVVCR